MEIFLGLTSVIIGVIAVIISFFTYKKASSIKLIDLRLELKKELNHLHRIYNDLIPLMDNANTSRINTLAARGRTNSGERKRWDSEHVKNEKEVVSFERYTSSSNTNINSFSDNQLEEEIIIVHKVLVDLKAISQLYEASIIEDKEHGKTIMDSAIKRHNRT